MKTVTFTENLDTPVVLKSSRSGVFFVIYGEQSSAALDYEQACAELGACLMHSLACMSALESA